MGGVRKVILSDQQILELVQSYNNGEKVSKLCSDYGFKSNSHRCVLNILRQNGCKIRQDQTTHSTKYNIDESYFEAIDSHDKAYFLGLLYADGSNGSKKSEVKISLAKSDKYILEVFSKYLETIKPLRPLYLSKKNKNWQDQFALCIENKKICNDLLKLGLIPKKSLILNFPNNKQVPEEFLIHFIRGYFDGDGCITISKVKDYNHYSGTVSFVGTDQFLENLIQIFKRELNITINKKVRRHKGSITNNFSISFGGNTQVKHFFEWLYKDSSLYLTRKYNKFKILIDQSAST